MYFVLVIINFVVIAIIYRAIVARFMSLMGANIYGVNVAVRFGVYLVLSLLLALLGI